jgi:hypothetical protein
MPDLTFYDAAWPPDPPPATDGVCIYIGGDTPHVWTAEEIGMQPARYRLPVFVRSDPRGIAGVASDVNAALAQLAAIKAPRGILVAWDMETAADKTYVAGVYTGLSAHGYELIIYGSQSDVMGNDNPDGLYWGADWTGAPHLARGDVMTQWVSFAAYDEDTAKPGLKFWDTQAKPPAPPAAKAAAPSVREWTTAGQDSLAALAAAHGMKPSTILRLTAEHSPGAEFTPAVAAWLNDVFAGTGHPAEPMPAGLTLFLPA